MNYTQKTSLRIFSSNQLLWVAKFCTALLALPWHEASADCFDSVIADFKKDDRISYRSIAEMAENENLSISKIRERVGNYFNRESYLRCRFQIKDEKEILEKSKSIKSCSLDHLNQHNIQSKDIYIVLRSDKNRYASHAESAANAINDCTQEIHKIELKAACTRKTWGAIETTLPEEFLTNPPEIQKSEILLLESAESSGKIDDIGPLGKKLYRHCLIAKSNFFRDKQNFNQYLLASRFWLASREKIALLVRTSKAGGSPYENKFGDRRYKFKSMKSEPFNSLVRVEDEAPGGGSCTGAFVNDLRTVVSSAHCFNKWGNSNNSPIIKITDERGTIIEQVSAKLVAVGNNDPERNMQPGLRLTGHEEDWVVLRLDRAPSSTHLAPLAPPLDDYKIATIPVGSEGLLALGYPAEWPNRAPIMAHCGAIKKGDYIFSDFPIKSFINNGTRELSFFSLCNLSGGASGGPLVYWDENSSRFRLAGIYSSSNKSTLTSQQTEEAESIRSNLVLRGYYNGLLGRTEAREYDAGISPDSTSRHIMSSSLLCAIFKNGGNPSDDCKLTSVPDFGSDLIDY